MEGGEVVKTIKMVKGLRFDEGRVTGI